MKEWEDDRKELQYKESINEYERILCELKEGKKEVT